MGELDKLYRSLLYLSLKARLKSKIANPNLVRVCNQLQMSLYCYSQILDTEYSWIQAEFNRVSNVTQISLANFRGHIKLDHYGDCRLEGKRESFNGNTHHFSLFSSSNLISVSVFGTCIIGRPYPVIRPYIIELQNCNRIGTNGISFVIL